MLPNEPEILAARRAFPDAQNHLLGLPQDLYSLKVGWYGSAFHPDRGCYAIAPRDDTTLVGDRLKLTYKNRYVYVYCFGSADIDEYELVITRRAFASLELLAVDSIEARVETIVG